VKAGLARCRCGAKSQVERDSKAGKLDHLLAELKDDIKAGRVKPLDEVINEP
jgi:hypothetical protein